jgi:hypothetical protein
MVARGARTSHAPEARGSEPIALAPLPLPGGGKDSPRGSFRNRYGI